MKILVAIKRVVDAYVKVRLRSDGSGIDTQGVKMAINPFCEIAIEEAVKLKEQQVASEVVVVSIGEKVCQEQLRTALALGADRAIRVDCSQALEPIDVARTLKAVVEQEQPQLVLMGKQSIDGDNNQTGQMLAGLLNWPQASFTSSLVISGEQVEVVREVDAGLQSQRFQLPAVITTDLRLNQPRFASLPNIMKARQKPLQELALNDLLPQRAEECEVLSVEPPAVRQGGVKVADVDELIQQLAEKEGVL